MKDEAPRHTWAIEVPARLRDWCSAHCHQRLLLDQKHDDHTRISWSVAFVRQTSKPQSLSPPLIRTSPKRPELQLGGARLNDHQRAIRRVAKLYGRSVRIRRNGDRGTVGDSSRFEPQKRLEDHLAIDTASDHGCIIALVVGEGIALGPRLDRFGATRSMRLHHHSKHQSSPSGCSRKHKHASVPAQQWVRSKQWRLRECREYASACQYRMPTYQSVDPNNRANQTSSE